jgi:DNA-directed RNA polymerase subunit K/omega
MNSDDEVILETDDVIDDTHDDNQDDNHNDNHDDNQDDNQDDNEDEDECIDIGDQPDINISDKIVEPEKRISKNKLTRYEFVRIIGERVMQLTKGAKPLIKQSKDSEQFTYQEIAIEELKANMIPFKIRRFVKDHYEIWKIEELNKKHLEPLFN